MSLPRPVEAVAFDMDGLLVDSEGVYHRTMLAVSAEMGRPVAPALFLSMIGTTYQVSVDIMRQACGGDFDVGTFDAEVERRVSATPIPLKPGVLDLMDVLDTANLPYALVTNSSRTAIEERVAPHGVLHRFSAVVFGGEATRGKPYPDPYLLAAQRLGVQPQACLALEDSYNGVRAAVAAGMMTVMVPDLLDADDEMRGAALRVERDLHAVCALIGGAAEPRP